ncbi:putative glycosyltransferase EpsF [Bacteroidia bacterium]|nr:putative glycosyltransferase EpsF [Bacteroidia bacterium]
MNKPIRVLEVFTIMDQGGAESMIMNYYRLINRDRVQFDFAVHRSHRGVYDDEIESLGGLIYRFLPVYPQNFSALQKQVAEFLDHHPEYSIIHVHTSELGYFFYKEASKRNRPVIMAHAHNAGMDFDLKALFRLYFRKVMKPYPTHYVACSTDAGRWLFGKNPKHAISIIPNAIHTQRFTFDAVQREIVRKNLGIEDKLVLCHVGRFVPQKNHDFLLSIFEEVHKRLPQAVLLLIGTGEGEEKIAKRIKDNNLSDVVLMLGSRADIPNLLSASDLFVLPSKYEGLPVSIVEAQTSGLPCVLSDVVSLDTTLIPEIIHRLPLGNAGKWADLIGKIKRETNTSREKAREKVKQAGYDIQDAAKKLEEFYWTNGQKETKL